MWKMTKNEENAQHPASTAKQTRNSTNLSATRNWISQILDLYHEEKTDLPSVKNGLWWTGVDDDVI